MDLGIVSDHRRTCFAAKMEALAQGRVRLDAFHLTPKQAAAHGLPVSQDGARRSGQELLSFPDIGFAELIAIDPSLAEIAPDIQEQLARDALYANYIQRQAQDVKAMKRDEEAVIPRDFAYDDLKGLSNELKLKPVSYTHLTLPTIYSV